MPKTSKTQPAKKRVRPNFYTSELSSEEHESETLVTQTQDSKENGAKPSVEVVSQETLNQTEISTQQPESFSKEAKDDKEFWSEQEAAPAVAASEQPEPLLDIDMPTTSHGRRNILFILIFVALVAGAVGAGTFIYLDKVQNKASSQETAPSPVPEETATPAPQVDISKYTLRVLNGSGATGAGARVKSKLESAGFVVKDATNADKSDYQETIIKAKKVVPAEYVNKLQSELEKTYALGAAQTLEESAKTDVMVIIGKKKASE